MRYEELKASGKLPSPKGVALAIIQLLQRDDFRLDELAHLVQSDPAIAGRVLKFANSAMFGHSRPIASLPKAVIALGAFRIRDLVLGFSVLQSHRDVECGDFDLQRFWSRSLAAAIVSQALAQYAQVSPEENFTVGLLSGVGELSLAALFPKEYGDLRRQCRDEANLSALELERFSTDHRELCVILMREWGLPEPLIQAAYHSEVPDASGFADGSRNQLLTLSLHLARRLADACLANESARWGDMPEMLTIAARLGIGPTEFAELADRAVSAWREWGRLLEVQTQDILPFAELIDSVRLVHRQEMSSAGPDDSALTMLLLCTDREIVDAFESLRAEADIDIRHAETGADAHAMVLSAAPQMLVLDIDVAGLDADAFCRAIRATASGRDTFILVLSTASEDGRLSQAFEAGADDFLVKPCAPRKLELRLRNIHRQISLKAELHRERRSIMRSADQWATTHKRLMTSAMTDPLTQLPNRRSGQDYFSSAWLSAHQGGRPLACLMLDIDHFKRINDTQGHEAGDHVLCQLAALLGQCLRSEDLAFRFGGEEFAIVCPGTDRKTALQVGERVRKAVESARFSYGETRIPVTVSVGVGIFGADHHSHEDMLREADQALYRAKETGRNKVQG